VVDRGSRLLLYVGGGLITQETEKPRISAKRDMAQMHGNSAERRRRNERAGAAAGSGSAIRVVASPPLVSGGGCTRVPEAWVYWFILQTVFVSRSAGVYRCTHANSVHGKQCVELSQTVFVPRGLVTGGQRVFNCLSRTIVVPRASLPGGRRSRPLLQIVIRTSEVGLDVAARRARGGA